MMIAFVKAHSHFITFNELFCDSLTHYGLAISDNLRAENSKCIRRKQASGNDFSHGCRSLSPGYGYEVMMKLAYVFIISTIVQRVYEIMNHL